MLKLAIGFVLGFIFASSVAYATVINQNGYLDGWVVVASYSTADEKGNYEDMVCMDPYVWEDSHIIECIMD